MNMDTLLYFLALALMLWLVVDAVRHPGGGVPWWAAFVTLAIAVLLLPSVAHADGGGPATGDPSLGTTLQQWTVVMVGAAVTSALGWLAPRVKHYLGARAAQALLDQRRALAKDAVGYVDQMEHRAGHVLSESEIAKHVDSFFAQHAIAGDAAAAVRSFIEAELGTRRAAAAATNRLANATQNLQDAMATGQLGKDIARLEELQAKAVAGEVGK
jgi:hypothetical protein